MNSHAIGVLAGRDVPQDLLIRWAKAAKILIAADAGAKSLIESGLSPIVIGDLDSLDTIFHHDHLEIISDDDQSTTDCDKLLSYAHRQGIATITLIGIEGDLLDHMLATLYSAAQSPLQIRLALRRGIGWIIRAGDSVSISTPSGRRVSLLPISTMQGVELSGVKWPLQNEELSPVGSMSISNEALGGPVEVSLKNGCGLLFIEYSGHEMPNWDLGREP